MNGHVSGFFTGDRRGVQALRQPLSEAKTSGGLLCTRYKNRSKRNLHLANHENFTITALRLENKVPAASKQVFESSSSEEEERGTRARIRRSRQSSESDWKETGNHRRSPHSKETATKRKETRLRPSLQAVQPLYCILVSQRYSTDWRSPA